MNTVQRYVYSGVGALLTAQFTFAKINPFGDNEIDTGLKGVGEDGEAVNTIQTFVSGLLTFLGLVMVAMALWGGWKILTSGSQDEGKEAGKKIIINAIIGIVVIFFAWTLTSLLFDVLLNSGQATG